MHLGESERPQDHDATGASSSYGTLLRAAALEHPSDPSQHTSMSLVNGAILQADIKIKVISSCCVVVFSCLAILMMIIPN